MKERRATALMAIAVLFAAAALSIPFVRYVGWLGDEGVLLGGGERMLRGETPYRDFFSVLLPLGYFATEGWLAVFGTTFAAARAFGVVMIAACAALGAVAYTSLGGRRLHGAILGIVWAAALQGTWTNLNHHYFTTALSLGAGIAALASVRSGAVRPAVLSGVLAGLAFGFTQSRGGALGVALFVAFVFARCPRKVVFAYGVAACSVLAAMAALLAAKGILRLALVEALAFGGGRYSGIQSLPWGAGWSEQTIAFVVLVPASLVLAAVRLVRDPAARGEPAFRAALVLAALAFATAFPRPDAIHVAFAAPLSFPLLGRLAADLPARARGVVPSAAAVVLVLVVALGYRAIVRHVARAPIVHFARGDVALDPSNDPPSLVRALGDEHVTRDPRGFFYPYAPLLPFLTGARQEAPLDVFTPGYTDGAQFRATCTSVLDRASWVLVDDEWASPSHWRAVFPALGDPSPPDIVAFEQVLHDAFPSVAVAGRYELRLRDPSIPRSACDSIPLSP